MKRDLGKLGERYGRETVARQAPHRRSRRRRPTREIPLEAMIEREPITVILSQRGWIRAMSGHVELAAAETLKFKEGDGPLFAFHAQTTDKLLLFADNGRFYTLAGDKLARRARLRRAGAADGRYRGRARDRRAAARASRSARLLLAASDGRGFIVEGRRGRSPRRARASRWSTPRAGAKLRIVRPIAAGRRLRRGDRRQPQAGGVPALRTARAGRGQGVQLQRYRDGGLSDAIAFTFAEGLSWTMGGESGRTRSEPDMSPWRTARGRGGADAAQRLPARQPLRLNLSQSRSV